MTGLHKFKPNSFCFLFAAIAFSIAITWESAACDVRQPEIYSTLTSDTIPILKKSRDRKFRPAIDSLLPRTDSTLFTDSLQHFDSSAIADTLPQPATRDTFSLKLSKDTLDAPVNYEASDSGVLMVKEKKIYLYGNTKTTYKDVVLTAPKLVLNQQASIVRAYSSKDSLGFVDVRARFQKGEENFQSDTIEYNYKTQKGLTQNTYTKQDEMWVQAELIKKVNENTTFAKHVIMTTCDYDEPHFAFVSNKGKFITNKVAITGPVHPEFEGVPIPIYLPFGIFPLNPGRHSGLLPPRFAVNEQFGIGLEGLGYYHVINDYVDATVRGNIYSYGGWSGNLISTYRKRYRFNGSFNFSYQRTKINFKGDPDYSLAQTFNIAWNHSVNQQATGTNFSASVSAGSTKYNQYVAYNPRKNVTNNQVSSINYSKTWKGTPFNLSLSANQNQNSYNHLMNITLPDAGFTVSTIYPFQKKKPVGAPKWYEKIGIGYSGIARNQVAFYDTARNTLASILDTMEMGAQHRLPISLSLPPLGKVIISPSVSYEETWLTHRLLRAWNETEKKVDTISNEKGFYTDRHISFGVSANTTLYGTLNFKNSKVIAIRHVVRPTFSLNYTPNLSRNKYDFIQIDSTGRKMPLSQFQNNVLFRGYGYGRFGGMSFGVDNNLEMKVRNKKDTVAGATKKVRLIDGFGFQSGYNFLQDSMKLLPFNLYLRSTLFEKVNLSASGNLNPYQVDSTGRPIDQYMWQGSGFSLGRLTNASVSLSTRFQSKPRDEAKAANPNAAINRAATNNAGMLDEERRLQAYMRENPAEFVDFNIPWSIDVAFSLNMNKAFIRQRKEFETDISSSISFNNSFSLTPKWNFTTNGFYDFRTKQLTQFTLSISRDMHCWQMSINITPIGDYRYFNITISPKSSILQDLRINRTRSFVDY